MRRLAIATVLIVAAAAAAGCVGSDAPLGEPASEDPAAQGTPAEGSKSTGTADGAEDGSGDAADPALVMDLPVHVVAVGWEDFDEDTLLEDVGPAPPSFATTRPAVTGAVDREPIQYNVTYRVHEAPPAFAEALFGYADSVAEDRRPTSFLKEYDRDGHHRICPEADDSGPLEDPTSGEETCEDVRVMDARDVEAWIADHRDEYGLDFGDPGYTVFVLNHHTREHLPTDTYHQYTVGNMSASWRDRPYRAWGGNHDFAFLDVSAGPNAWDHRPWWSSTDGDLREQVDDPIWDYEGDRRPFYRNLARNLEGATARLFAPGPLYPFEHADEYVLPVHVFVDTATRKNPGNPLHHVDPAEIPEETRQEEVEAALGSLVPWAKVDVRYEFHYLPDDDPGMHQALRDAESRHPDRDVDMGVVRAYIQDHWSKYVPEIPGASVQPTFAFWTDAASEAGWWYADRDKRGNHWGVFATDTEDVCLREGPPICSGVEDRDWWDWWNWILTHENGHGFGLRHPFHANGLDEEGDLTTSINWVWDSTATSMAYRVTPTTFSTFERDFVARHHAAHLAAQVLDDPDAAPPARDQARRALTLIQEGRPVDAVETARRAREATDATGVYRQPGQGAAVRGETETTTVRVPAGDRGLLFPWADYPWPTPSAEQHPGFVEFPVTVPENATALEIHYEEAEAPAHPGWAAVAGVVDDEREPVAFLGNNAQDTVVLRELDDCSAGCTGFVYGYGGAATTYEVSVTPLYPQGAAP